MSFTWPAMLLSLALLPFLVALYLRLQVARRRRVHAPVSFGLLRNAAAQGPGAIRHLPPLFFLLAFAALALALARPQATVSLPRLEGTLLLVFDVSASMAADDVLPTRLGAAQAAAEELLRSQPPTVRMGVVAFSDGGLTVQAPTSDAAVIRAAIGRLSPQRGTSVGEGLLAALDVLGVELTSTAPGMDAPAAPAPLAEGTAAIVLLSDGENNAQPDPQAVALLAAEQGVRIYTVGVGSTAGTTLQLDGFSVHSRLEEATLQTIARLSAGAYYPAAAGGLAGIYDDLRAEMVVRPEQTEITALFVGAGLFLLLVGALCSLFLLGRIP